MTTKYIKKYTVPSDSVAGKEYLVSQTDKGEWQCSCKHWITRHVECKHILRVKQNPEKYETSLGTTTIGLELNPSRRDNKRIPLMTEDERELRAMVRHETKKDGLFDYTNNAYFQTLTERIWKYITSHSNSGIDYERFQNIFDTEDFEDWDRFWLKEFAYRIEKQKISYYQPILKEIKNVAIMLDEASKNA